MIRRQRRIANDGKLREPVVMEVEHRARVPRNDGRDRLHESGAATCRRACSTPAACSISFRRKIRLPGTTLNGPEFAIFNTNTSLARVNFINSIVNGTISSGTKLDFTPVINAGTPDQMVDWLNTLFLHGTMSSQMKTEHFDGDERGEQTDTTNQAKVGDLSGDFVVAVSGAEVSTIKMREGALQRVPTLACRVSCVEIESQPRRRGGMSHDASLTKRLHAAGVLLGGDGVAGRRLEQVRIGERAGAGDDGLQGAGVHLSCLAETIRTT